MRFGKTAAVVGALAAAGLAAPAFASAPYTVTANGNTSGDYAFSSHSSAITFTVHNSGGDRVMTCSDVTVNGTAHAGSSINNPIANITSSTWNGCLFGSSSVTVTPNHNPSWTLNVVSGETTATNDNIAGNIGSVNAGVSTLGGFCTFTVTGSANGTFKENNGTGQQLVVNETAGNLAVSGASFGCGGQISNGNKADFVGTFDVSGAAVPIYVS